MKFDIYKYLTKEDCYKGRIYYRRYIDYLGKTSSGDITVNNFDIESEVYPEHYKVNINVTKYGKIESMHCNCDKFYNTNSCPHLAAALINYDDEIFHIEEKYRIEALTDQIFNLYKKEKVSGPKEEIKLDIELFTNLDDNNNQVTLEAKVKLGTDRLYQLKNDKLNLLYYSLKTNNTEVNFGKNFTYSPKVHYFNKKSIELIEFLYNRNRYNSNSFYYNPQSSFVYINQESIDLINLVSKFKYKLNDMEILHINEEFPYVMNLNKIDYNYELDFSFMDNLKPITTDLRYIQDGNIIYKIDSKKASLLANLYFNKLNKLVFDKHKINAFTSNILPIVKDHINIDNNIDEIVISTTPSVKLYFDLYFNKIVCNPVFSYDNHDINFFDTESNVLRDEEYENNVINNLYSYNFTMEDKKIIIDDFDEMAYFLDVGINELSETYETFTSKKIKEINIISKTNISSNFTLGRDNIMSYNFDFGKFEKDEIEDVLKALRQKKKYYKLKSGNIINIDKSDNLKKLNSFMEDLDIKSLDDGFIPKYRAIYIDSLKNNKYDFINTNNLFDELISKFNVYKDANLSLSKKDLSILRDYQVDGIKWLYNVHKSGFGGILADEMGLGKSIQTIYFIKQLLKEDKTVKFLIIVPTSLAYNWDREFDKFGSNIKYNIVAGSRDSRRELFKEDANVLVTTYGVLKEDIEFYKDLNFTSIIIDEAQNIKNPNTIITKTIKTLKAESYFALTGTPIENSVIELWSIFDYIMPGFLSSLTKFKTKYKVKEFDDFTNKLLEELNKIISPFILRRKKIDVIKELPEKIENNIYIDLSDEQKKLYVAELDRVNEEIDKTIKADGMNKVRFMILQLLIKLRQLCIDPRIIYENYKGGSNKIDNLIEVLKEVTREGHKVLLFTSFKTALDLVKKELDDNDLTSYTIDGSVSSKKRMELVDKFNNDDTNVFLIMLKAGGTGLNLTSADIVIHLDLWWNPQAENQATDRAHRIGQKNKVEVIKFVTKGTIEEKILNLQEKKKILSDKLIDEGIRDENILSTLTEKDIKELLSYENK